MLGSVKSMHLVDVDLASVPAEHLASLASCVTRTINIANVSNCDLISIRDNLKCDRLVISEQTLSSEETRALVRAMESHLEDVWLGEWGDDLSLDITALTQYNGQGQCLEVVWYNNAADKYSLYLNSWAKMINWGASVDDDSYFWRKDDAENDSDDDDEEEEKDDDDDDNSNSSEVDMSEVRSNS